MGINPVQSITEMQAIDNRTRVLLLAIRQAIILILGALEVYLEIERSVKRKHLR
jgi:hypothetical protein